MSRVVITGPSGGAPNRLEINTFVRNERFFSLYIQALQQMYSTPEADDESFFGLAGIHGLPYEPWNDAEGNRPFDPSAQWGGYCVHGSVLFPTWHRPYLMLFEQILQAKAKAIAATYTVDTAQWQEAAENIRQPYWDWAANIIPPDQVIALENVTITGPDGRRVSVPNPLFKYTFQTRPTGFPAPYNQWNQTYRQPTGTVSNPTTNITRLRNQLRASQTSTRTNTYNMLTRVRSWTAFSNHTVGDGGSGTNSVEAIHDQLHVLIGGSGQMSDPGVAAFDPIFFLHHCNVDRLISLWAAINPTVWVTRGDSENGTFTMPAEIPVDVNTPLTPFWNSATNDSFWASAATRNTATLGYSYPEFNGLDMGNPTAVRTAIVRIVNSLYSGAVRREGAELAAPVKPMSAKPAPVQAAFAVQAERSAPAPVPQAAGGGTAHVVDQGRNSGLWDWTARIEFEKYELNCSFSVLLFIGPVPENPDDWLTSPNFVGMHSAFVNSAAGRCANCRHSAERGLVEEGFVHLDDGIIRLAGLTNLDPGTVDPYLRDHLSWRVEKADGSEAQLNSLEVKVFATPLSYPSGADFPVAGERQWFNGITHGKAGGSREA